MSDFFLPQMGDVLTEGVILALFADASGPGFAALGDRRARCCARERQAPKNPAAWERSRLSKSWCPDIKQPAMWQRPESSELEVLRRPVYVLRRLTTVGNRTRDGPENHGIPGSNPVPATFIIC